MALSVQIGLLLALACAFLGLLGFLFKQRGAAAAPPVSLRRPVRSTLALFRNGWWTLGIVVAMASWVFHVGALALAPISLVQATIAAGLVLLAPMADRLFGFRVSRREWIGVALTALGLAFLAATLGDVGKEAHGDWEAGPLAVYGGLMTVLAGLLCLAGRASGPLLAAAAGLMWGVSDVTIKALSGRLADGDLTVFADPLVLVIVTLSLAGLVVSARSLQLGPAVPVIAITSAAANVCTIASGVVVFGEPLPEEPLALAVRLLAFALVIGAAALTPGPQAAVADPRPRAVT
jgi:multidrug transporter EmrE-like cation transporter